MRKYNGLPNLKVLTLAVGVAVLLAACASEQSTVRRAAYATDDAAQAPVGSSGASGSSRVLDDSALPVSREIPRLRESAPLRYVVQRGDTLWDISQKFLLDSWQWPEIWYVNDKVANPHLIYPGDVLTLVNAKGGPRLVNNTVYGDLERFSPMARAEDLNRAIPGIPIDAIRDFLSNVRLITPEELKGAPYVLDFVDPQLVAGAGSKAYVRNLGISPNYAYNVIRLGEQYRDPDNGDVLGYEAIPVGEAEVRDFGAVGMVSLTRSTRETRAGDYLLPPQEMNFDAFFYPKPPKNLINGRIISVLDGASQIGQYAIVAINRGSQHGLERGDVLTIMQTGRVARDPYGDSVMSEARVKLPDVDSGTVMLFKVLPRVSYALVMTASRQVHRLDRVVSPTSLH